MTPPSNAAQGAVARPARRRRTEEVLRAFHEEAEPLRTHDIGLLVKLWAFLRPYRRLLLGTLLVILLTSAAALARPLIMLRAIDEGVLQGDADVLTWGGIVLVAVVALEQLLTFVQIYATQVVGARAMADLRRATFRFLHGLRLGYFDRQPIGRLVTRVTNDIDSIQELFASGALNAAGDLLKLVGIVVLMLALDYKLALIGFAAAPPAALLVVAVRRRMRHVFREIRSKTARMNATMNEQVSGMDVVQAYGRQAVVQREFEVINAAYRDANLRSIKYEAVQDAAIETIAAICLASIVMSLGYRPVSFGTLVAFNAYLIQFFEPISMLAQRYTLLQTALSGAERVFGLLEVREPDAAAQPAAPKADDGSAFALEQVNFSYKAGTRVLHDLTLRARPGEKIALVGPTGSGKSTIAGLLLRLYDVESGVVRVGGDDVVGLERRELRQRFAVVPQDVFLFPGSVASNIAAGREVDPERVRQVLERVGALDLFESRPGGIEANAAAASMFGASALPSSIRAPLRRSAGNASLAIRSSNTGRVEVMAAAWCGPGRHSVCARRPLARPRNPAEKIETKRIQNPPPLPPIGGSALRSVAADIQRDNKTGLQRNARNTRRHETAPVPSTDPTRGGTGERSR